ncbi:MAG: TylF/MycF/NovP-related O-methyltransferase, partial [Sporolactobacillus sp.]
MVRHLPGAFIECGVFKGASFCQFAMFREILDNASSKQLIGFDIFDKFPETEFDGDKESRNTFINSAGIESISKTQLEDVLQHKGAYKNVELIKGDITLTVPDYLKSHPELKISLLNLDTDIYEPAVTILENLYPRLVNGGILIIDDYGVFPGEPKAVDEYFQNNNVIIRKFSFAKTPNY